MTQGPGLSKGAIFDTKTEIRAAALRLTAALNRSFKVKKSDRGQLKITMCNTNHTCPEATSKRKRQVTSDVLAVAGGSPIREFETRGSSVKAFRSTVAKRVGVDMSYTAAHSYLKQKGRYTSLDQEVEEMLQLPAFMDLLKDADENGTYLLRVNEVDDDSPTTEVFDGFLIIPSGAKTFWGVPGTRKVASADGGHLKSKVGGTLLHLTTKNANNELVLLAFALVRTECDESWRWFAQHVAEAFPDLELLLVDGEKGIENGFSQFMQDTLLSRCVEHLIKNAYKFDRAARKEAVRMLIYGLAKATTEAEYQSLLSKLQRTSLSKDPQTLATWFDDRKQTFSAVSFLSDNHMTIRFGDVTNNMSEQTNSFINEARELPPIQMIKHMMAQSMDHYTKARERAIVMRERDQTVTTRALDRVGKLMADATKYTVQLLNVTGREIAAAVSISTVSWNVGLEQLEDGTKAITCPCLKHVELGHPCVHVMAVFRKLRDSRLEVDVVDSWNYRAGGWFSSVYWMDTFEAQYVHSYVPGVVSCDVSALSVSDIMRAWPSVKNRGAPKKKRRRGKSEEELTRPITCR